MIKALLLALSILWIRAGAGMVIYTDRTKTLFNKLVSAEHIKWWAVLPLGLGLILVIGAFRSPGVFWLALVIGLLAVLKGGYLLVGPSNHIHALTVWWREQVSDETVRLFGLVTLLLGGAILSLLI
jgi:hypothetical protein